MTPLVDPKRQRAFNLALGNIVLKIGVITAMISFAVGTLIGWWLWG